MGGGGSNGGSGLRERYSGYVRAEPQTLSELVSSRA
jgi:hypothetical protein